MLDYRQLKAIYSNEQVFIILLARLQLGTCSSSDVAEHLNSKPLHWPQVFKLAKVHHIRPFLYSTINAHGIQVPTQFLNNLKKRYQLVKLRNFNQAKICAELIEHFARQQITLIPYKGALFAETYYSDWAARESVDLDFLANAADIKAIEDYFISCNYKPLTTVPRPFLPYYKRFFKDLVYHKSEMGAAIEIHWRLMERFSGNYPAFGFFSVGLVPDGEGRFAVRKLAPTYDFLAVVSNHFVKDMSVKFKYLIDIAFLIQKERSLLDKELIVTCARTYAFQKRLSTGLQFVDDLLGVALLPEHKVKLMPRQLAAVLAEEPPVSRFYINELPFLRQALQLQDNGWQKIRFLLRCLLYAFLPTYADINQLKLPVCFLPLLILMRPFRLLYQAFRQ